MLTKIRRLPGLSWLGRWGLSFGCLALVPFVVGFAQAFIFPDAVLANCSHSRGYWGSGSMDVYKCPSLEWDAVVQTFVPRLPVLLIPFLWLLAPRWSVRLAALVAGLLCIGATLLPVLQFVPFIGAGPVTFEGMPVARAILKNGTVKVGFGEPPLWQIFSWGLALLVWGGVVVGWLVRRSGRQTTGSAVCPQCGHRNSQPHRFCRKCGAPLAPATSGVVCPQCGHRHTQPHLNCKKCGAPLEPSSRMPAG